LLLTVLNIIHLTATCFIAFHSVYIFPIRFTALCSNHQFMVFCSGR